MKGICIKVLSVSILALMCCHVLAAQDYRSGIGVKVGNNMGVDYKIFVNESQALDIGLGVLEPFDDRGPQFVLLSPQYLFHFNVFADGVSFFAGPGLSAGIQVGYDNESEKLLTEITGTRVNFYFSIDAALGIEYKVPDLPLALAFAWSPKLQICGDKKLVRKEGGSHFLPHEDYVAENRISARLGDLAIGIRYVF